MDDDTAYRASASDCENMHDNLHMEYSISAGGNYGSSNSLGAVLKSASIMVMKQIATLAGVSIVIFMLLSIMPGDPAEILLTMHNELPSPENLDAARKSLGLDKPLYIQYFNWLEKAVCLDFGRSFITGEPVMKEIGSRLKTTLILAFSTFMTVILLSTAGGVFSALFNGRMPDTIHRLWSVLILSIPDYWLGTILILILSLRLKWLPCMVNGEISSWVMPVLTLGLAVSAVEGRVLRASILETLTSDHVKFALAKGLSQGRVIRRHVLREAILPLISMWGVLLGHLLGGSVIVETIFSIPGLGQLTATAVLQRDIPAVLASVMIFTLIFQIMGLFSDMIRMAIDPKIAGNARRSH